VGLSRRLQADLYIIGLSAIWGCTFVVIKQALQDISPLLLITIRFGIASLPLYFLVPRGALWGPGGAPRPHGALVGGAVTGGLLFAGFVFQTTGLQYTAAARSAFITSMYVIFTPLLSILLRLRRPAASSFAGAALAVAGLHLLTSPGGSTTGFARGEILTLLCALAFSGHLLAVDHYTRRYDKSAIAFAQIAVVGALGLLPALLLEPMRFVATPRLFIALGVMSLVATALAFYVLNLVQSWTSPTRAAIIFAAEPVFAVLTSLVVEGEVLRGAALLGAALILAGMLISEIAPAARRRPGPAL